MVIPCQIDLPIYSWNGPFFDLDAFFHHGIHEKKKNCFRDYEKFKYFFFNLYLVFFKYLKNCIVTKETMGSCFAATKLNFFNEIKFISLNKQRTPLLRSVNGQF